MGRATLCTFLSVGPQPVLPDFMAPSPSMGSTMGGIGKEPPGQDKQRKNGGTTGAPSSCTAGLMDRQTDQQMGRAAPCMGEGRGRECTCLPTCLLTCCMATLGGFFGWQQASAPVHPCPSGPALSSSDGADGAGCREQRNTGHVMWGSLPSRGTFTIWRLRQVGKPAMAPAPINKQCLNTITSQA